MPGSQIFQVHNLNKFIMEVKNYHGQSGNTQTRTL